MSGAATSRGRLVRVARARRLWLVLVPLLFAAIGWLPSLAAAGERVIPRDHEPRVRAALDPYALGDEVGDGVVLHSMQIDRDRVRLSLVSPAGPTATLILEPRRRFDPRASASFSFVYEGDPELEPAAERLAATIRRNDLGDVYLELDDPRPGEQVQPWAEGRRTRYLALVAAAALASVFASVAWRRRSRVSPARRPTWGDELLAGAAIVAAVVAAGAYAWVCDDATISMRYAWHLAQGDGLVFNVGERVQGFTNPLWTLALAAGPLEHARDAWATAMGLAGTTATLLVLWACVLELGLARPGLWFAAIVALAFACQPVLAFSTSGLENSATHLFVSACLLASLRGRANVVMLAAGLALLNRLDTAPLLLPLALLAWRDAGTDRGARWRGCRLGLISGAALLAAWFGFATIYYGYPLPNTWYAKGNLQLETGVAYVADFIGRRPSSAMVLLGGPLLTLRWSRQRVLRGAAVGVLLQLLYVVSVGGDYMHGRFLTAPMLLASLGLVALLSSWAAASTPARTRPAAWVVAGLVLWTLTDLLRPQDRGGRFVIERNPEVAVWAFGLPSPPVAEAAHRADGSAITEAQVISNHLIGHVYASPDSVHWLDGYGLTDPYIARCPPVPGATRPGHVERQVPRAYLRARGDLRQLPDGRARVEAGDPSVWAEVEAMRATPGWPTEEHRIVYEQLQLLTRGPIFDRQRLRTIPRYLFDRRRLPPISAEQRFDIVAQDQD